EASSGEQRVSVSYVRNSTSAPRTRSGRRRVYSPTSPVWTVPRRRGRTKASMAAELDAPVTTIRGAHADDPPVDQLAAPDVAHPGQLFARDEPLFSGRRRARHGSHRAPALGQDLR